MKKTKKIGAFELVTIPSLGITDLVAKIDTGAWSGAFHCTDIHEEGERLFFTPLGKPELATSTTDYEDRRVRSSNGEHEDRYRVPLSILVNGDTYRMMITLTDRSPMKYEMLIGRKFLRDNQLLVDVSQGVNYDIDENREDQ